VENSLKANVAWTSTALTAIMLVSLNVDW